MILDAGISCNPMNEIVDPVSAKPPEDGIHLHSWGYLTVLNGEIHFTHSYAIWSSRNRA